MKDAPLLKAIALAGSASELSRRLGLHPSAVAAWKRIPLPRVLAIEGLFPGEITRYEMRPDYWAADASYRDSLKAAE